MLWGLALLPLVVVADVPWVCIKGGGCHDSGGCIESWKGAAAQAQRYLNILVASHNQVAAECNSSNSSLLGHIQVGGGCNYEEAVCWNRWQASLRAAKQTIQALRSNLTQVCEATNNCSSLCPITANPSCPAASLARPRLGIVGAMALFWSVLVLSTN